MAFVDGELFGDAECLAGGQDGDFGDGVAVGGEGGDQGVAAFVDGDGVFFVGEQRVGGFSAAEQDPVAGFGEVGGGEGVPAGADGIDGGFVDEVGEVGAGEAGGAAGDDVQLDVGAELFAAGVDLEDGAAFSSGG